MICGFIISFKDGYAILETAERTTITVDRSQVPDFAKVGDFLVKETHQDHFHVDLAVTEQRHQEIRRLADAFFE